ncbi:MAG: PEP-CTERM sorting domain-containing protein, partial [Gemmatimonadaceae bacterium]
TQSHVLPRDEAMIKTRVRTWISAGAFALITPFVVQAQIFNGVDISTGIVAPGAGTPNTTASRNSMLAALGATPFTTNNLESVGTGLTVNLGGGVTATYTFFSASGGVISGDDVQFGYNTTPGGSKFLRFAATPGLSGTMTLNFATAINFFGGYFTGVENVCGVTTATWGATSAVLKNSNGGATCNGTAGIQWFGFVAPASAAFNSVTFNQVPGAGPSDFWGLDDFIYGSRAVTVSPEPSTYLLMLGALSVLGVAARRRRA